MAASIRVRPSGLAAMVGGLLWITTIAVTAWEPEHHMRGPGGFIALLLVGLLLIAVGVLGIHVKQRGRSGRLGTAAVLTTGMGIALTVLGRVAVDIGIAPAIVFQAGLLIFIVGLVLFVISIFVANVMPRGAAWLLVIGTLSLVLFNFGDERIWIGVLFGAAWIWLGYALWSDKGGQAQQTTRVR